MFYFFLYPLSYPLFLLLYLSFRLLPLYYYISFFWLGFLLRILFSFLYYLFIILLSFFLVSGLVGGLDGAEEDYTCSGRARVGKKYHFHQISSFLFLHICIQSLGRRLGWGRRGKRLEGGFDFLFSVFFLSHLSFYFLHSWVCMDVIFKEDFILLGFGYRLLSWWIWVFFFGFREWVFHFFSSFFYFYFYFYRVFTSGLSILFTFFWRGGSRER
ncbi:hypothetical protein DFH27DRAFT_395420 [Peziza echinospora]|nr:hypothetical protein DFH27DRAFT_395420 [Peziza echinospora]